MGPVRTGRVLKHHTGGMTLVDYENETTEFPTSSPYHFEDALAEADLTWSDDDPDLYEWRDEGGEG